MLTTYIYKGHEIYYNILGSMLYNQIQFVINHSSKKNCFSILVVICAACKKQNFGTLYNIIRGTYHDLASIGTVKIAARTRSARAGLHPRWKI